MPLITFSSPIHKDKTIYAPAGSHRETILKVAKDHHIPIDFSCGDGECGTCLVRVSTISKKGRMGGPLTDKERGVLKDLKKITQAEIDKMDVDDLPTSWRLSCQMVIRDEDILVEY